MPLKDGNSMKYYRADKPTCPFCDYQVDVHEDEMWYLFEEGDHEVECPSCLKVFRVESIAKWMFTTDDQDDD